MLRLRSLQERNSLDQERRAGMRSRFDTLEQRGNHSQRVAVADGLFITPPEIAARMAQLAEIGEGMRVLEPSAGTGRILDAVIDQQPTARLVAVENCPELVRHLFEKYPGTQLKVADFLDLEPGAFDVPFDRIVMNPPFRRGTDVRHIMHALRFLAPGGRLVSLCYNGREQLRVLAPMAKTWELLPAGSFKGEGTGADVVMLMIQT